MCRPVMRDGYFILLPMKPYQLILFLAAVGTLFCGCASDEGYRDEQEYSNMPWNTPQQWEGSRQLPGMSPGY